MDGSKLRAMARKAGKGRSNTAPAGFGALRTLAREQVRGKGPRGRRPAWDVQMRVLRATARRAQKAGPGQARGRLKSE
jgi:hypothetical protein